MKLEVVTYMYGAPDDESYMKRLCIALIYKGAAIELFDDKSESHHLLHKYTNESYIHDAKSIVTYRCSTTFKHTVKGKLTKNEQTLNVIEESAIIRKELMKSLFYKNLMVLFNLD